MKNSSTTRTDITKTVEIFEPFESEIRKLDNGETIYRCTNCQDKIGKPDTIGKLYYNTEKQVGYCFRCHTVFYPETQDDETTKEIRIVASAALKKYSEQSLEHLDPIEFSFNPLNDYMLSYLRRRNPFLPGLAKKIGFQAWYGTSSGVVTPFWYKGNIVKFQARFVNRKKGAKYYTSKGQKISYSPQRIFDSFKIKEPVITICEGVYDAIALAIMGYPNPVAVLGDRISDRQIHDLRRLIPEYAYLALDDWERSKEIRKTIKAMPSISDTLIVTWGRYKDPEEYLVGEIKKDRDLLTTCVHNVKEWINE